jgi:hypothetical protein
LIVLVLTSVSASAQTRKGNKEGWMTNRQIQAIQNVLKGDALPLKDGFFDEWQRWEPDKLPTTRALLTQMGKESGWKLEKASATDEFARYYFVNSRKQLMFKAGVDLFGSHPVLIISFINRWNDRQAPPKKVG